MRQYASDIFSNHLANMYRFYAKFTTVNTRRIHEIAKNIC